MKRIVLLAAAIACLAVAASSSAVSICDTSNCANFKIMVTLGGGSGTVTSEPAGIACKVTAEGTSGTCEYQFVWPLSQPTLPFKATFTAETGSLFEVQAGAQEGQRIPVYVWQGSLNNGNSGLYAKFVLTTQRLDVSTSGVGSGRVVIDGGYGECRGPCFTKIYYGTKVTLKAVPDDGAVFKTWTGACKGQGATCKLTITKATATNAVFDLASSGGTTPPPTQPPSPPTGGSSTDTTVDAQVFAARPGKSRLGARVVRVELDLDEDVAVTLLLLRSGKQLASKSFARVREGDRILTLLVPRRVAKGQATLKVVLADSAGNKRGARRTITIPKP